MGLTDRPERRQPRPDSATRQHMLFGRSVWCRRTMNALPVGVRPSRRLLPGTERQRLREAVQCGFQTDRVAAGVLEELPVHADGRSGTAVAPLPGAVARPSGEHIASRFNDGSASSSFRHQTDGARTACVVESRYLAEADDRSGRSVSPTPGFKPVGNASAPFPMSGRGGVTPDASKCGAPSARSHLAGPARPPATHYWLSVIRIPSSCCARVTAKSTKIHRSAVEQGVARKGQKVHRVWCWLHLRSFACRRFPLDRGGAARDACTGGASPPHPRLAGLYVLRRSVAGVGTRFPLLLSRALTRSYRAVDPPATLVGPLAPRWRPQATLPAALGESLRPSSVALQHQRSLGRDGPVPCNRASRRD